MNQPYISLATVLGISSNEFRIFVRYHFTYNHGKENKALCFPSMAKQRQVMTYQTCNAQENSFASISLISLLPWSPSKKQAQQPHLSLCTKRDSMCICSISPIRMIPARICADIFEALHVGLWSLRASGKCSWMYKKPILVNVPDSSLKTRRHVRSRQMME